MTWRFDRNGGRRGDVLSFRELPENVRNEEREGALASCQNSGNRGREGAAAAAVSSQRLAEMGGGGGQPLPARI